MERFKKYLQWTTVPGKSVEMGTMTVTPLSQALVVRIPFFGFAWNRPVAIQISDGQSTERVPIVDVTRMVQVGAYAVGIGIAVTLWLLNRSTT